MNEKYTLQSLCREYDRIEIPIIQRDYAQGRDSQGKIRNAFVEYLVDSLVARKNIELDFVYGNVREDISRKNKNLILTTFIPIDGQQRLTTLWLLHWFLAVREGRLEEISEFMRKFTYETRPSTHDFCSMLLTEKFPSAMAGIAGYIRKQNWFDDEWENDGSIVGMLTMLDAFSGQKALEDGTVELDQLLAPNDAISFYFVPLKDFGLSEDLYIKMNARGKILTDFENFKSEFYKIIKDYPDIDTVKDKMEYEWVNNLWDYRKKQVYVIDECFMNYLSFITKMLYFQGAKSRSSEGYASDFLDFKILREIYSDQKRMDFLVFALDSIQRMRSIDTGKIMWYRKEEKKSLADMLQMAIKGDNLSNDIEITLYAALLYHKVYPNDKTQIVDYLRTVRNLIVNTPDKSEREYPRMIGSLEKLKSRANVFDVLRDQKIKLEGFRDSQCDEEYFKVLLRDKYSNGDIIRMVEDNDMLRGNITSLIKGVYGTDEDDIAEFELNESAVDNFDKKLFERLYAKYVVVSENDFDEVWGDMLNTGLYIHKVSSARMVYSGFEGDSIDYPKCPAMISMVARFEKSKKAILEEFLIDEEKTNVKKLATRYKSDFASITNVKEQLYLYYVLTRRVMKLTAREFFSNGYNFGWLVKEKGYVSLFECGIEGDPWHSKVNPIFQTYNSQFRYNSGLYVEHALPCEVVGGGKPQKPWEKLLDWANQ